MDPILYPDRKPARKPVDDGTGELFPEPPKPPTTKPKLPLPTLKVPKGTVGKACACSATIYKVEQPSGRFAPINCGVPGGVLPSATTDGIGINHFIDCPLRDTFRATRRR